MKYNILKGNIINEKTDAVVLPANTKLKEGKGASEAIFKAAGRTKLEAACKKIGRCDVGSAVPTPAYDMQVKYIIHAVVPKWKDGNSNEYELLCAAYISVLELADAMECESISIPLLASGNNGYDVELAFEIAIESIDEFNGKHLKEVNIIIFTSSTARLIKSKGYEVGIQAIDLTKEMEQAKAVAEEEKRKNDISSQRKKIIKHGAEIIIDRALHKGIEYITKKENIDKILDEGKIIIKKVMKNN